MIPSEENTRRAAVLRVAAACQAPKSSDDQSPGSSLCQPIDQVEVRVTWAVDIDEGRPDDPEGRRWDVIVSEVSEAVAADANRKDAANLQSQESRNDVARQRALEFLRENGPDTTNGIFAKSKPGIAKNRFRDVLLCMLDDGEIVETPIKKHTREEVGYRLPE